MLTFRVIKKIYCILPLAEYTVVEDNSLLAISLETKRLHEMLFRTFSTENNGKDSLNNQLHFSLSTN